MIQWSYFISVSLLGPTCPDPDNSMFSELGTELCNECTSCPNYYTSSVIQANNQNHAGCTHDAELTISDFHDTMLCTKHTGPANADEMVPIVLVCSREPFLTVPGS